ncbi:hypothetical protein ACFPRL_03510 [Pseudoclavibacter helvolus]
MKRSFQTHGGPNDRKPGRCIRPSDRIAFRVQGVVVAPVQAGVEGDDACDGTRIVLNALNCECVGGRCTGYDVSRRLSFPARLFKLQHQRLRCQRLEGLTISSTR